MDIHSKLNTRYLLPETLLYPHKMLLHNNNIQYLSLLKNPHKLQLKYYQLITHHFYKYYKMFDHLMVLNSNLVMKLPVLEQINQMVNLIEEQHRLYLKIPMIPHHNLLQYYSKNLLNTKVHQNYQHNLY